MQYRWKKGWRKCSFAEFTTTSVILLQGHNDTSQYLLSSHSGPCTLQTLSYIIHSINRSNLIKSVLINRCRHTHCALEETGTQKEFESRCVFPSQIWAFPAVWPDACSYPQRYLLLVSLCFAQICSICSPMPYITYLALCLWLEALFSAKIHVSLWAFISSWLLTTFW